MRQGACVGSGRQPTTTCTHTRAIRHATSGTSMEGLWVSMWAWVASRGPPNRRSQIAGPGGYVSVPLAPGTKHRTASRPCGYLCLSARRRDMIALGNSDPRAAPAPPRPGGRGLGAGSHGRRAASAPSTHVTPNQPPTADSPPVTTHQSPRHFPKPQPKTLPKATSKAPACAAICAAEAPSRAGAGVGGRGGEGADAQHRRRAQS